MTDEASGQALPLPMRRFATGGGRARGVRGHGAAPAYRMCLGCGVNYRSNYIRRHEQNHCPGQIEDSGGAAESIDEARHVDESVDESGESVLLQSIHEEEDDKGFSVG